MPQRTGQSLQNIEVRGMKIGLQDAVRTVHSTKRTAMQNGVITAGVVAGTGALANQRTLIGGDVKHFLAIPQGHLPD